MNKSTINRILSITVGLALLGVLAYSIIGINIFSKDDFHRISGLISGIVAFWGIYFTLAWKWPIVNRLLYRKNLNGTWYGTYRSKDFTSNKEYRGNIAIVIRQTFLNINIKSFTNKYVNFSFGEALDYDSSSESYQLIYLYSQSEFNPADDSIRKGTSELKSIFASKEERLFGDFWTNHNSKGVLKLTKVSKRHAASFEEAQTLNKKQEL